jgi:iron complex outermembrane receptor protein
LLALSPWKTAFVSVLLVLGVSLSGVAYGQQSVSGTVTDAETGNPLPGVNIRVVGTETGTVTGPEGAYEVSASSPDASLRFSFVGYETRTVAIDGRSTIDVRLQSETLTGTEVVVTGYSERRRRRCRCGKYADGGVGAGH